MSADLEDATAADVLAAQSIVRASKRLREPVPDDIAELAKLDPWDRQAATDSPEDRASDVSPEYRPLGHVSVSTTVGGLHVVVEGRDLQDFVTNLETTSAALTEALMDAERRVPYAERPHTAAESAT